jgi:nitric oxide reductase NorD protein
MSEPEELLIEGAHFATRVARDAWRRFGPGARGSEISLSEERPRLELFLAALFGRSIAISAAEPPPPMTWLSRLANVRPPPPAERTLLPATDGSRVFLPPALPRTEGPERATDAQRDTYRLLAVEQGARLARGTARTWASLDTLEARDWLLVREAAIVDRWIATGLPGLLPCLRRVREEALERRATDSDREDPIEHAIRALLASDPAKPDVSRLRRGDRPARSRYRPMTPVWYWGQALAPPATPRPGVFKEAPEDERPRGRPRVAEMRRRPLVREAAEDEDDRGSGTWVMRADEPQESVEDPYGLQRPTDRDDEADPEGLGDSLSDLPEARVVRTPGQAREVLRSGEEIPGAANPAGAPPKTRGIVYPEWDYRVGRYRPQGAIVRETDCPRGDAAWVEDVLARHGRLVRQVRSRFERMRPRRVRLSRQPDGAEIDVDAYVTAAADLQSGVSPDSRLYVEDRPARRELAVALLVDVSASTDAWVCRNRRIVDLEKDALLIVCEALDALGDRYGIFAFSGNGARNVAVVPVKRFEERSGRAIERRVAALDADRYTRIGAAIRHVSGPLCRERTDRRLLLILSDGKPNDEDEYEGRYGIEDTRQAIAEARRQGITPFCLTVDRAAPRYASRIFGRSGFAVLRRPEDLPLVLVDVLRQLIRP